MMRLLVYQEAQASFSNRPNRFLPILKKIFRKYKRPVGGSWRMDETYIKVKGAWRYRHHAVDRDGKTIDFLLTTKRDKAAAKRFFDKAMQANGIPEGHDE